MTKSVTCPCNCHKHSETIYCGTCQDEYHPKEVKRTWDLIEGKICHHDLKTIPGYTCNKCIVNFMTGNVKNLMEFIK